MKQTFLEYYQIILEKVSFNKDLFQREYIKAKKYLNEKEIVLLDAWVQSTGRLQLVQA